MIEIDRLLRESIDKHIHAGPGVIPQRLDALEADRPARLACGQLFLSGKLLGLGQLNQGRLKITLSLFLPPAFPAAGFLRGFQYLRPG